MLIFILAVATTVSFKRIRKAAALLMVPYLVWLAFATVLAWEMDRLNPDAEKLIPPSASAQIAL